MAQILLAEDDDSMREFLAKALTRAGHDVRNALITFGTDATHGYERTHISSLLSIAHLLTEYAQTPAVGTIEP